MRKFNVIGKSWLGKVYKSREVTEGLMKAKKANISIKKEDFTSFIEITGINGGDTYQFECKNDVAETIIETLAEEVSKYCEYSITQNGIKWTVKENTITKTFVAETYDNPTELPDWIGDEIKE